MSGGHWDYLGSKVRNLIENALLNNEEEDGVTVEGRWPLSVKLMLEVAEWFYAVEHDMDWDLSGDSFICDDGAFDMQAAGALLDRILKALPDELFSRGKWATIQAWQERTGCETSPGFKKS